MDFTPKINGWTVRGLLMVAAVGLIAWFGHEVASRRPAVAAQESIQAPMVMIPAVWVTPDEGVYQPVSSWYKNKHWWKRNAPIVGGAGGGALIGGLAGGGAGALIGGAAGGGGGYLYKRYRNHHNRDKYYYRHR